MDEQSQPQVDYYRLLRRVVVNRWRLILLVFVGVAVPMTVHALFTVPKTYEGVARVFFEDGERNRGPSLLREWLPTSSSPFQLALLQSRSVGEAVIGRLSPQAKEELLGGGMNQDYLERAQNFARWLRGHELIFPTPQTRILDELDARVKFPPGKSGEVEIHAIAYQPQVAMELANAYVRVLQARGGSFAKEEGRATRAFIESSLDQAKKDLEEAESALAKLRGEKGVVDISQRSQLEAAKVAQLESSLADVQTSKEIAKVRLSALKGGKEAAGASVSTATGRARQQVRDRLRDLEEKLATLLEKYTDQHPLVVSTLAEIDQARATLGATLQGTQDSPASPGARLRPADRAMLAKDITDVEVELSTLEAREEVFKQRIGILSRSLTSVNRGDLEGMTAVRKVEATRSLYNLLSERLGTARMQEQAESRGVRVIDYASLPTASRSTPLQRQILLGLLLGLGLSSGIATAIEYFKQPVDTEEDVAQATGLPVLGWLPLVRNGHPKTSAEARPLSFAQNPTRWSIPLEGCRAIRTSVESLSQERPLQSIMLASPGPREGKSTVLVNLGWVFWELGRRLVVVDADLRRPTLHRALRSTPSLGITDLLTAKASWEKVRRPIKEDFVLLPGSTTVVANPGALLRTEKVRGLLDLLKDSADLILFDSAPVLAVSDNLLLASLVDGVILVVRAGHTQRRDLIRAKQRLEGVGARLLGVVLNQVSPSETRRYYTRYASYYTPGDVFPHQRRLWDPRSWWQPKATETYGGTR